MAGVVATVTAQQPLNECPIPARGKTKLREGEIWEFSTPWPIDGRAVKFLNSMRARRVLRGSVAYQERQKHPKDTGQCDGKLRLHEEQ